MGSKEKAQIKTAGQVFKDHQLQGYKMFDISEPEKPGGELKVFDPAAEEILAVPQLQAG